MAVLLRCCFLSDARGDMWFYSVIFLIRYKFIISLIPRALLRKKAITGHSIKIREGGERIGGVMRQKNLGLDILKEIAKEVHQSDICSTAIKYVIGKIVHTYVFKP